MSGAAVALERDVGAEEIEQGRQHVDVLGDTRRPPRRGARRRRARVAHDQRHVERRVEPAELVHEEVVAEHLAVVGRHHDDRALGLARRVEVVEDPAELVVDLGLHAVVRRAQLPEVLLVVGAREERMVDERGDAAGAARPRPRGSPRAPASARVIGSNIVLYGSGA